MAKSKLTTSLLRISITCAIGIALMCGAAHNSLAQPDSQRERQLAFQLLREGKFAEAQAKFEKLVVANPSDGDAQFGLGYTLLATSKNIAGENERRKSRIRARTALLQAKQLGVTETFADLLETSIAAVAPDGSDPVSFSESAEADKAMKDGEAAFARQDYDQAIEAYGRALKLQPNLYHAALFIGDAYFQKKQVDKAGEWYGRAIAIDPDRETAYRYWSDVLLKYGRMEEARAKAIEAIVAEPYNRQAYSGLVQWAQQNNVSLGHPLIQPPDSSSANKTYWSTYDAARSAYPANFKRDHPNETSYRHSLKEEAIALRAVAEMVTADLKSGKLKSVDDVSLANLLRLHQADLIEPYILFGRPDEGISQDYADYRKTNRDKLKRYWAEVVISRGQ